MVLVFGATGFSGTLVVQQLVERSIPVRIAARSQEKLEALYVKLHKDAKPGSLEAMLDARYRKMFPTLHVARYQPTPERSDRTVLAEIFTGSGCPPCVAADLAFDAMMEMDKIDIAKIKAAVRGC